MSLWDVAMAPVRAVGGAVHELDMASQGTTAKREAEHRRLLTDLRLVQETTPQNTPARIEAIRQVMGKHGLPMPPVFEPKDQNPYQPIPSQVEQARTEAERARAENYRSQDPVARAKAVSQLIGMRPWSGDEGDTYDESNPEHRVWMQSLQELGGSEAPDSAEAATETPRTAQRLMNEALAAARTRPGSALSQIETPDQWRARVRGDRSQEQANAAAHTTPIPLGGLSGNLGNIAAQTQPAAGPRPGSALAGIPSPSPEQIDAALGQYEQAGGVTVRNAQKVRQSQAAPASALMAAARAVRAYKASPEYVEMTRTTGRLLNETDLSGQIKTVLSQQSASDQKRLLALIHKHGEAKVLAALADSSQGHGQ